jgi:hypothetical protein
MRLERCIEGPAAFTSVAPADNFLKVSVQYFWRIFFHSTRNKKFLPDDGHLIQDFKFSVIQ